MDISVTFREEHRIIIAIIFNGSLPTDELRGEHCHGGLWPSNGVKTTFIPLTSFILCPLDGS